MSAPELKQADNGVWYIHWTEGRRSKRESTRTKELATAKTYLGHWLLMAEAPVETAGENLTCAAIWKFYETEHVQKKSVDRNRPLAAWKNLAPYFGDKAVNQVKQTDTDAYVDARQAAGAKLSTIWFELSVLTTSWNYAVKKRVVNSASLPQIERLAAPAARDRWLRDGEIQRLLDAAAALRGDDGRLTRGERFLWLALETAARKRAIETLRWEQVDFETRVIHYLKDGERQTKKRKASVPISDVLLPVLRRAYDERQTDNVLGVSTPIYKELDRIVGRAKVEGVTPHVLRHTAATILARNGVPLWIIAEILGNSVAMVEKVYAKHCPEHARDAINKISAGRVIRMSANLGANSQKRPSLASDIPDIDLQNTALPSQNVG